MKEVFLDTWFMDADFSTLERMGFKVVGLDEKETQKKIDEINAWWKALNPKQKEYYYSNFKRR